MSVHIELNYGDLRGGQRIPRVRVQQLLQRTVRHLKLEGRHEVSIAFVNARAMKRLNEAYYGGAGVTDVLAFPAEGLAQARGYVGEILVYYPRAKQQAHARGGTTLSEVELLLVHGFLHLLGYDHDTPRKKSIMFTLQEKLLSD